MIWATSIRPSSDGYPYQPSFRPTPLPLAPYSSTASSTNIVNMPVANQFAAPTSQPVGWKNCLAGLFTPSAVPTQSAVPLKRPLDASHQLVAPIVKAETVAPAHSYTVSTSTVFSQDLAASGAQPAMSSICMYATVGTPEHVICIGCNTSPCLSESFYLRDDYSDPRLTAAQNANVVASTPTVTPTVATVVEPAAKRPALQRAYNTTTTQTSTNGDATALPIRERPPLVQ